MMFTRTAIRIVKPLWSSLVPRYCGLQRIRYSPIWAATTGGDPPKRGIFGKAKEHKHPIDGFLGEWDEVYKENFDVFLAHTGFDDAGVEVVEWVQTFMRYERSGDDITYTTGYRNINDERSFTFQFGKPFVGDIFYGQKMKALIYMEDHVLRERLEFLNKSKFVVHVDKKLADKKTMDVAYTCNMSAGFMKYQKVK